MEIPTGIEINKIAIRVKNRRMKPPRRAIEQHTAVDYRKYPGYVRTLSVKGRDRFGNHRELDGGGQAWFLPAAQVASKIKAGDRMPPFRWSTACIAQTRPARAQAHRAGG